MLAIGGQNHLIVLVRSYGTRPLLYCCRRPPPKPLSKHVKYGVKIYRCWRRARRLADRRNGGETNGVAIGSNNPSGSTGTGNAGNPLPSAGGDACKCHMVRFYRHGYNSNAGKRFRSAANQTDVAIPTPPFAPRPEGSIDLLFAACWGLASVQRERRVFETARSSVNDTPVLAWSPRIPRDKAIIAHRSFWEQGAEKHTKPSGELLVAPLASSTWFQRGLEYPWKTFALAVFRLQQCVPS